jgi:hypothetical protein
MAGLSTPHREAMVMTPFTEVNGPVSVSERQILIRIDGGIKTPEEELRYQLDRKDQHPLANDETLIDVLADLEARGLIRSMLYFVLTDRGKAELRAG